MSNKRGQGEGSISKRPDGTWWARASLGYDSDGKRIRKAFYGKTRKEVQEKLTAVIHGMNTDTYVEPSKMTVQQWMTTWLDDYRKNSLKPQTYNRHILAFRKHIYPTIGSIKLKDLRPDILQKFVNGMVDKGLKRKTCDIIFQPVKSALKKAVQLGLITKNPALDVDLPPPSKVTHRVLTPEEQKIFVEAVKTIKNGEIFILALATGLRIGELLALKWSDIDFENGILHVNRTAVYITGNIHTGTPKTRSSIRTVPLIPSAIKLLEDVRVKQNELKEVMGSKYEDNDFIFTITGKLQAEATIRGRMKKVMDKTGLKGLHPHCLRHTFATRGLENGIELRVMQELLGHASIKMTADLYTHVLPEKKKESIMKLSGTIDY